MEGITDTRTAEVKVDLDDTVLDEKTTTTVITDEEEDIILRKIDLQ